MFWAKRNPVGRERRICRSRPGGVSCDVSPYYHTWKRGIRMAKNENNEFFEITPEILELTELCKSHSTIDTSLYAKYDVKRGLRDINGKGVLTGLTEISDIISSKVVDGKTVPCEGKLYYRGIDVQASSAKTVLALRKPSIFCCLVNYPMRSSWTILSRL